MPLADMYNLPYAYGRPALSGVIRYLPEDFMVEERLSFELSGQGEHVYLFIEKRDCNTAWLVKQLARLAGVKSRDIGYAGLKDKRAVTRQWFSIYFPKGDEPHWQTIENENISILRHTRHQAKLRRGAIAHNHFVLTIRELHGDFDELARRIQQVERQGVPNYFTEQRFGREQGNLRQVVELFTGKLMLRDRHKRSLLYSAARSYLFNLILAERIRQQNWDSAIAGDVMLLSGSRRFFGTEHEDLEEMQRRVQMLDIHPSAVLWGKGVLASSLSTSEQELAIVNAHPELRNGLIQAGIKQARRSLRLLPSGLCWQLDEYQKTLKLEFELESGGYATAVLRELCDYRQSSSSSAG